MMLFKTWDTDGSNSVSKHEFRRALKELRIRGGIEDYDSLFDSWDSDGGGSIQFGELLAAMSGRRYDAFEAFDSDLGDAEARIAAAATEAYLEATAEEAAQARERAEQVLAAQRAWLLSRWRAAQQGISVAIWLAGAARQAREFNHGGCLASTAVQGPSALGPLAAAAAAATAASRALTASDEVAAEDVDVGRQASEEATRLSELALTAQLDLSAEKQLRAEDELKRLGLCQEHVDLESAELLPLVTRSTAESTRG